MPDSSLLIVVVLLATTVVLVGLLKWLRLPAIFAYLLTGVLLGPHALALVPDLERTRQLAEFGVVFLMFSIGLEFSPAQFMAMRRLVFGMGSLQVLASLLLFLAIATFLGLGWRSGIIVGGILAMSSTAMVARVLSEKMETASRHGRIAISILLFQDLAVVPLLVLIPALAGDRAALPAALAL
jgi:CPA2 family monovalent cation:H+ antiporter-2